MCKINGRKLGEIREEKGLSQAELAKELGTTRSSISSYERGVCNPSEETVDKICLILNISKDDVKIHEVGYNFLHHTSETVERVRGKRGFVRYSTPEKTEKMISEKRTATEEEELKEVQIALNNSFGIGKKKYILVNPTFIHIPEWQRDTDMAKVTEIAENFDEDKFDPIKVYIKNGKLHVADGSHRVVAFVINGELKILVEVLNCTEHEATLTFLGQSAGRKPMSVSDMYRAGVKANIEEYITFKEFFEGKNIQITAETSLLDNPIGIIRPSSTILRMVKYDKEILEKAIELIRKLEWSGSEKNAYTIRNLQVIKKLYSNFGEEVENKLLDRCKGATFYEGKVAPVYKNAELFDILSEEISK